MATYKITVKNQTGEYQDYSFFNERPTVAGGPTGSDIWSNVMKTAKRTSGKGGIAVFEVSTDYFAICGTVNGQPGNGGRIAVSKTVPISLGNRSAGAVTLGTTVPVTVTDKSSIDLGEPKNPGQGKIANFQFDTSFPDAQHAFAPTDAKKNNLLIGIASSADGDLGAAMGTFHPAPNVRYQIQPKATYYVSFGNNFQVGELVKAEMVGNTMAIDFVARQTNEVTLIHDDTFTFAFE
ncbi:hypothetical protein ACHAPO_010244 [Fusarium lateritium]